MYWVVVVRVLPLFFFFHDMQATEIYTLSLHDALPISKKAKELGLKPIARIKAFASAGVDPKYMGMGPVPASKRCLSRAGWEPKDLDLMEINEAFAAQAIAVNRQMGTPAR